MKKKMLLSCVVSLSLIILFVLPANALFDSDVKKAKEFMTAGMYPQAIELLNKRINDKPTDAEAHFQLGVCYVNTGNYSRADERFGSAVKLKPDYGYQIGGKYKKVGDEALNKGNTGQAQSLYQKAVQYQPDLKADIAKECFSAGEKYLNQNQSNTADGLLSMAVKLKPDYGYQIGGKYKKAGTVALNKGRTGQAQSLYQKAVQYQPDLKSGIVKEVFSQGKSLFDKGQYDMADNVFSVAIAFDSSLSQQISDMYFNLGQSKDDSQCLNFYRRAKNYSNSHDKEIGERFLTISKSKSSEKESQRWKKMASAYIEVPPDYKIYQPGTYNFPLKAGETTDHWIMFPAGRKNMYDVSSTAGKFILKFDDGTTTKSWSSDPWPSKRRLKFKITAVEVDQIMTLYVK
jgi:tetratricopeptide (TPR) repeat protein